MALNDFKGEAALDLLADILDPMAEILTDPEFVKLSKDGAARIRLVKPLIKNHKKAVIQVLAAINQTEPGEYEKEMTVFTLPAELLKILNDPMLKAVFTSQGPKTESGSSGSAMENTGDGEK